MIKVVKVVKVIRVIKVVKVVKVIKVIKVVKVIKVIKVWVIRIDLLSSSSRATFQPNPQFWWFSLSQIESYWYFYLPGPRANWSSPVQTFISPSKVLNKRFLLGFHPLSTYLSWQNTKRPSCGHKYIPQVMWGVLFCPIWDFTIFRVNSSVAANKILGSA